MIIDVHTHIFPDQLALDVVPKMAEIAQIKEALDGRLSSLKTSMKEAGIDCAWIQPVATKPKQVDTINHWMEEIRCDEILPFAAVHPDYENLPELIRDLASRDFPGVKIHPEYHKIAPDDIRLFPLYQALSKAKMIALFHAGVDIGIPTINSTPQQFAYLKERFPELIMILAHMGGFQQWEQVKKQLCGYDVYMDTSYVFGHISDELFIELVKAHGSDRILFGTDSPWADQKQDLEHLKSLPLSEREFNEICGQNAKRLLMERLHR